MKGWPLAVLLALAIASPLGCLGWLLYNGKIPQNTHVEQVEPVDFEETLAAGMQIPFEGCNVYDGYRYGVVFENQEWIIVHLAMATKPEAKERVEHILRSNKGIPSVKLLRRVDDYWIVDLYLDEQNTSLLEVLKRENLLLVNE